MNSPHIENTASLGNILRQKRKEMNLTLKEAENATSIRISYLQALEDGEMKKLISPIYAQGFFKQYASFLGIDGDQLIRDHPGVFTRAEVQEFDYGIGTLEGRGNPGSGVKWFPNALWIMAFVAILILAWYFARLLGVIG
ncbi:MAG: helix-turn-helix domain-containing protein [Parachlamydiaceae bacterium]